MEHNNKNFEFYNSAILGKIMTLSMLFASLLLGSVILSKERNNVEALCFVIIFLIILTIITTLINRTWPKKIRIVGKNIEIVCNWQKIKIPVKSIDICISPNLQKYSKNMKKFMGFNIIEKNGNKRVIRIRCFMVRSYKNAEDCYNALKNR